MNVLGISAFVHDSSVCLIRDGEIIFSVEEERLNRIKHTSAFPTLALQYLVDNFDIKGEDIDVVATNWNPYVSLLEEVKKASLLNLYLKVHKFNKPPKSFGSIRKTFSIKTHLEAFFGKKMRAKVCWVPHHLSHAASSLCLSGHREADILVADGHGEGASTTYYKYVNRRYKKIWSLPISSSLGILYQNFTHYLGFGNYQEGTTMALAALGKNTFQSFFDELITLHEDGKFRIKPISAGLWSYYEGGYVANRLGPPRKAGDPITQRHKDIAASLQEAVKNTLMHSLAKISEKSRSENLCLAGGVFLNCDINGQIGAAGYYKNIFVPPFTSDTGGAIGAALYVDQKNKPIPTKDANGLPGRFSATPYSFTPYLGPGYSNQAIHAAILARNLKHVYIPDVAAAAARDLADGALIGWFQGRMEGGPRALGNRSILASPLPAQTKDLLNAKKQREDFRPFSPITTPSGAKKYFSFHDANYSPSLFMLATAKVKPEYATALTSVIHVDGSSRVQIVTEKGNGLVYKLLTEFMKITGYDIILNTSFNQKEPVVCSPGDALNAFLKLGLDFLYIGNYKVWIEKTC